jgi:Sulfotransferase family/Aspartyl/Asparaginyl beta-hydroxylase/SEC-C motif
MKLASPFIKLPLQFDAARMAKEVAALPDEAWVKHPTGFQGNAAVRLISANGEENDNMGGAMLPTAHLLNSPYLQQVLAAFNTVFGRSRLMGLGPHSEVPAHSDVNHHWFYRVRIHVPIVTYPEVRFHCDSQDVHMGAGEAWIFDNWRRHFVINPTDHQRVHLVADTTGSAAFWEMANQGIDPFSDAKIFPRSVAFDPQNTPTLLTERFNMARVMPPAEMQYLVEDLLHDLHNAVLSGITDALSANEYIRIVRRFVADWRDTWSLYGEAAAEWPRYQKLRLQVTENITGKKLLLASNRSLITPALMGRVVLPCLALPLGHDTASGSHLSQLAKDDDTHVTKPLHLNSVAPVARATSINPYDRPLIILTAPRSGSTLLFETLQQSNTLYTIGGESHGIIEAQSSLNPASGEIDSNRLDETHANAATITRIRDQFSRYLRDASGRPPSAMAKSIRLLEKTPKNALRIPFLEKLFPESRYVFLYRDPREAISSIMDCWRNGGWVTYSMLEGWPGPWSFLLPPNWQRLKGSPLAEIAAFQWCEANQFILNDLKRLDASRWIPLQYDEFLNTPARCTSRIANFAEIPFDGGLRARTESSLPHSRLTLTPPSPDKWRKNEAKMLPYLDRALLLYDDIKQFARMHQQQQKSTDSFNLANSVTTSYFGVGRNELCPCGSGERYKNCHGKLT